MKRLILLNVAVLTLLFFSSAVSPMEEKGQDNHLFTQADIFHGPLTKTPEFNTPLAQKARREIIENKEICKFCSRELYTRDLCEDTQREFFFSDARGKEWRDKTPSFYEPFDKEKLLKSHYANCYKITPPSKRKAVVEIEGENFNCSFYRSFRFKRAIWVLQELEDKKEVIDLNDGLEESSLYGDYFLTLLFLQNGVDPNKSETSKLAYRVRNKYIARLLVAYGMKVTSPLLFRVVTSVKENATSVDLFNYWIECGADVKAKDEENYTLLHVLANQTRFYSDTTNYMQKLVSALAAGVPLDEKNNEGYTAEDIINTIKEKMASNPGKEKFYRCDETQANIDCFCEHVQEERAKKLIVRQLIDGK